MEKDMRDETEKENMNIVIVGHVDHGKSTLIGRLMFDTDSLPEGKIESIKKECESMGQEFEFAFIMDSLSEEMQQGITIDTAQIFFNTDKREYVIIDAPGHKEFTKNMITGASQAEAAVLLVDINEGLMEQTRRHAYMLSLLGINQLIVVVNKMDSIDYNKKIFDEVRSEIEAFLASLNLEASYIIPISAKDGVNIAKRSDKVGWYNNVTVLEALDNFDSKDESSSDGFSFSVQDVYGVDSKKIIVGRVESGRVSAGDDAIVLPLGTRARVGSIEVFGENIETAQQGASIGIVLADGLSAQRGDVLCNASNPMKSSNIIKANLFWMSQTPLNKQDPFVLRCTTQETPCRINAIRNRIDSSTLKILETDAWMLNDTEVGEIEIITEKPIVADKFSRLAELGRFVLEKGNDVVAGGIVTNLGSR